MFNDLFVVKIAFVAAVFAWLFTISDAVTQTQPNSFAQICKAELPEYSKECSCFITFKLRNPSSRCMDVCIIHFETCLTIVLQFETFIHVNITVFNDI